MSDCNPKGPLPTWSVSLLVRLFRSSIAPVNVEGIAARIPEPTLEWLTTDPGTKSHRRRKSTRNADLTKRGSLCCRCGATERIEIHHVVPLYISEEQGYWRDIERETVDLCVTCHNLYEEAIERVCPVTMTCNRWAAGGFRDHPEWLDLVERGLIESRVVRWALSHFAREPQLIETYRLATQLFLDLELPLTDRRVLSWQLRRRLGSHCERCGKESGILPIISLPFAFVTQAIALGYDPLDPRVRATLCHPCARAYVHAATKLGSPDTDLAIAIQLRTDLLRQWILSDKATAR